MRPFPPSALGINDVILNGGEAAVRDRTSAESSDAAEWERQNGVRTKTRETISK
jgi:hypothetical protein